MTCRSLVAASAALLILAPAIASAEEPEPEVFPTRGGFFLGGFYGFAAVEGEPDYESAQYPTGGAYFDHEWFHGSVDTPMGFVIIDGIIGVLALLGGEDIGLPVFGAFHGERDPGRFRVFDFEASVRPLHAAQHALEVGARVDVSLMGPYIAGERVGDLLVNVGPTAGYVYVTRAALFRAFAWGGNGFGDDHDVNAFVGAGAEAMVHVSGPLHVVTKLDLIAQRVDLRQNEPYSPPIDLVEWAAFGTTTIGLGFTVD